MVTGVVVHENVGRYLVVVDDKIYHFHIQLFWKSIISGGGGGGSKDVYCLVIV